MVWHGQTGNVVFFDLHSGTRERHGRHSHETMQPFVNHLMSTSGLSRRYSARDLCRTNQLLFSCSIQWTTRRKRSSGDTTGKSLAFSVSSMGRACGHVDQRSFMSHASLRQEEDRPWPSSSRNWLGQLALDHIFESICSTAARPMGHPHVGPGLKIPDIRAPVLAPPAHMSWASPMHLSQRVA